MPIQQLVHNFAQLGRWHLVWHEHEHMCFHRIAFCAELVISWTGLSFQNIAVFAIYRHAGGKTAFLAGSTPSLRSKNNCECSLLQQSAALRSRMALVAAVEPGGDR